jgi:PadR family transcriptional regulator PadR
MAKGLLRTDRQLAVVGFLLERHGGGGVYGSEIMDSAGLRSGVVYPILAKLERLGWIVGDWEDGAVAAEQKRPRRRYYRLTDSGVTAAREYCARGDEPGRRPWASGAST